MGPVRQRPILVGSVAIAALLLMALLAGWFAALLFAPACLLFLPLLAGRYVGEEKLQRLVATLNRRRQPRRHTQPTAPTPIWVLLEALGPGRLTACLVSGRGPPMRRAVPTT